MKKQKVNSMIDLPDHVLIDKILLKLDTKSLGNLRCACKYLQSFITSPDFVKMHCHDQFNNNPLVLLVSDDKNPPIYSLSLKGTHIKHYCPAKAEISSFPRFSCLDEIASEAVNFLGRSSSQPKQHHPVFFGSCNGLLCLVVERENSPPILWNPTTKEYKKLPPPLSPRSSTDLPFGWSNSDMVSYSSVVTYGLGYDSIVDDYKVMQCKNFIYTHYSGNITKYTYTEFQVYTLGTDTWRRINDDDNPYRSYCTTPFHNKTPGMFVNGALHWILREKEYSGSKIIAFDIEKEMFRTDVPKPHSRLIDDDSVRCYWSLHVLKGCLCIYDRLEYESPWINVWMMKNYGAVESWTKLFTINDFGASTLDFRVLKCCENCLIVYDPINEKFQTIKPGEITAGKPDSISYTEIHIQSLVSLKTGIYIGKTEDEYMHRKKKKKKTTSERGEYSSENEE